MSIEAMKQALEALEHIDNDDNDRDFLFPHQCTMLDKVITSLRQAIARAEGTLEAETSRSDIKQSATHGEPVGWLDGNDKHAEFMHKDLKEDHDKFGSSTPKMFRIPVYLHPNKSEIQKPVAWVNHGENIITRITGWNGYGALYTHPYVALQRQPKADQCTRSHPHEEMDAMCELRTEIARLTNQLAQPKAEQEPKRRPSDYEPLTDEHIDEIASFYYPRWQGHQGFARAIEAAHGIKVEA